MVTVRGQVCGEETVGDAHFVEVIPLTTAGFEPNGGVMVGVVDVMG